MIKFPVHCENCDRQMNADPDQGEVQVCDECQACRPPKVKKCIDCNDTIPNSRIAYCKNHGYAEPKRCADCSLLARLNHSSPSRP